LRSLVALHLLLSEASLKQQQLLLLQVGFLAVLLSATAAAGARTWRSQMQQKLALQCLQAEHCKWPVVRLALKLLQPQ
jgi:hypothetical protein